MNVYWGPVQNILPRFFNFVRGKSVVMSNYSSILIVGNVNDLKQVYRHCLCLSYVENTTFPLSLKIWLYLANWHSHNSEGINILATRKHRHLCSPIAVANTRNISRYCWLFAFTKSWNWFKAQIHLSLDFMPDLLHCLCVVKRYFCPPITVVLLSPIDDTPSLYLFQHPRLCLHQSVFCDLFSARSYSEAVHLCFSTRFPAQLFFLHWFEFEL